jgi:Phenylalanyl tRNA synthetase beta chain CLM domain/tRNA synthetase B5 domain
MPNVDFERGQLMRRMPGALTSPDFEYHLLSVKVLIDSQSDDTLTLNFMDTLRPELWCVEGLARILDPIAGQQYDLEHILRFPRIEVHFENLPDKKAALVLFVDVNNSQQIVDDGYFFKKVRDQLGFGSSQQIDVTILPGMQREIRIAPPSNEDEAVIPSLALQPEMNTVVFTALDERIATWLWLTFACNYIDRGHILAGYTTSLVASEQLAKWEPFTFTDQYVRETFGFTPSNERFKDALQSQHFKIHHDETTQTWYVAPPMFRFDIIHPIDILEDYLVVTHYNEVKPTALLTTPALGGQTRRNALEERLTEYMRAYGARQTIGLLLDSQENVLSYMRHDAPQQVMRLANAVNRLREYVVDSSLVPLLRNAVHASAPQPPTTFYLFTETIDIDEASVAHSLWKMGILLVGTEHPFNNAHTLLDALCYHLRLPYTLKRSTSPALIPGRQMDIYYGEGEGMFIGRFGEVHPEVLTNWELFYPASFIELDLDTITKLASV